MVEIAISLAVIGIALVSIIGVLPIGMNTQRDNREETLINQDATILMEAIRGGARGLDDLTNYVYAITNYWTRYNANGSVAESQVYGYTYTASTPVTPPSPYYPSTPITNGLQIIGLLSLPEFTDLNGKPIPTLLNSTYGGYAGGYSNHVVAYVRSISGPAIEKPPQTNDVVVGDSFGYRVLCVNAPVALDTNLFYLYGGGWVAGPYGPNDPPVFYQFGYWQAVVGTADVPGTSPNWLRVPVYGLELAANLRELRLTFYWPQQPNGSLGPGRQSFRTRIAGPLVHDTVYPGLYFYRPQSFATAP
jgi:type II secretory pathway pseudopilin PulG